MKKSSESDMSIFAILEEYGRFQNFLLIMFIIMLIPAVSQIFLMYFCTITPTWKCISNNTECIWNGTLSADDNRRCNISRSSWYYTERKSYSLVTEFDIHCEDQWQLQLISALFFVGMCIGSIFIGWSSDRFGRKFVIFPSVMSIIVIVFINSFLKNIYLLMISRLISGFFFSGTKVQMFILMSEYVGANKRPLVGNILFAVSPMSYSLLALQAYLVRDWRILSMLCTAPYFMFVIAFYKFVPESIKWLHENGKVKELHQVLHRIAYWNHKDVPPEMKAPEVDKNNSTNPLDLFRTHSMAKKTLILAILWITISLGYYSLHLASNDLGGSVYRDFTILCMAETITSPISAICCKRYGRKNSVLTSLLIGSLMCLLIAFTPSNGVNNAVRVSAGIIGNVCMMASFSSIYVWSAELYPVLIQSQGLGFHQLVAHVASAAAPWLTKDLKPYGSWCPFVAVGVPALLASGIGLWLPETRDNPAVKFEDKKFEDLEGKGVVFVNDNIA